jgi:hypothetical protein
MGILLLLFLLLLLLLLTPIFPSGARYACHKVGDSQGFIWNEKFIRTSASGIKKCIDATGVAAGLSVNLIECEEGKPGQVRFSLRFFFRLPYIFYLLAPLPTPSLFFVLPFFSCSFLFVLIL